MKILIVGSGGREHVLAWKVKQSPLVKEIFCAPGNGGISEVAQCVNVNADDTRALVEFAREKKIDLTVIGPEAPLAAGIVDVFEKEGLKVFGPSRKAAQLEGSKIFAKEFMHECNIPTAHFRQFDDIEEAKSFLRQAVFPLVVKADGLAAGKGVVICKDFIEAEKAVDEMMAQKIFKDAGSRIVVEECLEGEEVSILAISDGDSYCLLESSQDHKRIFDDDVGPNTGGMGAYSPAPLLTDKLRKVVESRIIEPTIRGMQRNGMPFKGVLYAGVIFTAEGPMVLEFNVRFGDPEAQAILPRMKNDIVELMLASCEGWLDKVQLSWDKRSCVCVVMSSGGYPGEYEIGKKITGLKEAGKMEDTVVFHAGTKKDVNKVVTSGGRVLGVTSLGNGLEGAIENVYKAVDKIKFERCFFRRDIGSRAFKWINRRSQPTR
jgi:phosphoribosylamine--glycine ligase